MSLPLMVSQLLFLSQRKSNQMIKYIDKRRAHEILDMYDSINKNDFINKKISEKPSSNILLEDSIERIRSYIANIAEETINYYAVKNTLI